MKSATGHLLWSVRLLFLPGLAAMVAGCGGPEYPMVTYPPPGARFPSPDLAKVIDGLQFDHAEPIEFPPFEIPKPSAELEFTIRIAGSALTSFPNLSLHIEDPQGRVVTGGGGAATRNPEDDTYDGIISILGPARRGTYRLVVRLLDATSEGDDERWRIVGSGPCVVN